MIVVLSAANQIRLDSTRAGSAMLLRLLLVWDGGRRAASPLGLARGKRRWLLRMTMADSTHSTR